MSREQQEQALDLWKRKKADFERELATTSNPALKFELRQLLRECEQEIQRLENNSEDEAFLDIAKEIRKAVESVVSPSREVDKSKNMSANNFNQRKIERLQRDLDLAQKQCDELTELIDVIVDEINENRGDAVRQRNLNKKKKRYEEERNQYDQESERLQAEIDKLAYG